ncbi:MAG TPA: hypothetical protein VK162_20335 [Streptosporangiaceae bacterium]|nr:hypothetical protein [Streptosporangiaceae bacterium]
MSQQPPHALHPRSSRAPQHAVTLSGNVPLRVRAHRAMKLFLIVVVWLAGLFIVIAAVMMVAVATAPMARTSGAVPAKGHIDSHGKGNRHSYGRPGQRGAGHGGTAGYKHRPARSSSSAHLEISR